MSVLEAGVGDGVILKEIMAYMPFDSFSGFDISKKRIKLAKSYIDSKKVRIFEAEMSDIPMEDNSVDVIYTVHALEPNHGREEEVLKELLRVCSRYVILIEPSYELGNEKTKRNIRKHGYCRNLVDVFKKLDCDVVVHSYLGISKITNQNAISVLKKRTQQISGSVEN